MDQAASFTQDSGFINESSRGSNRWEKHSTVNEWLIHGVCVCRWPVKSKLIHWDKTARLSVVIGNVVPKGAINAEKRDGGFLVRVPPSPRYIVMKTCTRRQKIALVVNDGSSMGCDSVVFGFFWWSCLLHLIAREFGEGLIQFVGNGLVFLLLVNQLVCSSNDAPQKTKENNWIVGDVRMN